jgi:hypothetical protein
VSLLTTFAWPDAARTVRDDWDTLSAPGPAFTPTDDLPDAARRWVRHAIAPGTPLHRAATITMHGSIRLGRWRPFTARQVLAPGRGFIWAAKSRLAGLPISGFDRYSNGAGEMRWRLAGRVPLIHATGPDVTRSAVGRLAAEFVCVPTSFPGARWSDGPAVDTAIATWSAGGQAVPVEVRVWPDGRLRSVVTRRWGDPGGRPFGRYRFTVTVDAERTFAGVTVPAVYRAAWEDDGDFYRATVSGVTFG